MQYYDAPRNFKVFAYNPFDSLSLAEDNVIALFQDSRACCGSAHLNTLHGEFKL